MQMPDREKVIRGLEHCKKFGACDGCPYVEDRDVDCGCNMCEEALALLRGQTGQWIWDRPHHFRCSGCGGVVGKRTYLYCPNCGREMFLIDTEQRKEWPDGVRGDD